VELLLVLPWASASLLRAVAAAVAAAVRP